MRYCQICHRCFTDSVESCLDDKSLTSKVKHVPLVIEGKYRLDRWMAHGGMGTVYRATHLQLGRAVAIKILRPELLSDPKVVERFTREARAVASLRHPNIISIYDFGILPGAGSPAGAYLVMELIEGRSLREEMRRLAARHRPMTSDRAIAVMQQICAGVEAAHRSGIIHRDLKPDNIMLEANGDLVKVLDFGVAKLKENEQNQSLTDEGMFIGTPSYISPEQCTAQPVNASSDVYSLGVILYEMLTGIVPFSGDTTSGLLLRHLNEVPAAPSNHGRDIGHSLERVILMALEKNPARRPSSAADFSDRLIAAVKKDDETVEAKAVIDPSLTAIPLKAARVRRVESRQRKRHSRLRWALVILLFATVLGLGELLRDSFGNEIARRIEALSQGSPTASVLPTALAASPAEVSPAVWRPTAEIPPATVVRKNVTSTSPALSPAVTSDVLRHEVRAVYAAWTMTAVRGDWRSHMNFYGDRVDYYKDGLIPRTKVEARKKRIFAGLDSYKLHFAEEPAILLRPGSQGPEADVVFDKDWALTRASRVAEGRARTLVSFRRDSKGWHIVGERQVKLFFSRTRRIKNSR
jgi:serine/threonine protein kinase